MGVKMAIRREHELHQRRAMRNMWLGLTLGGFVVLVLAITIVKLSNGAAMEAFDHSYRNSLELGE